MLKTELILSQSHRHIYTQKFYSHHFFFQTIHMYFIMRCSCLQSVGTISQSFSHPIANICPIVFSRKPFLSAILFTPYPFTFIYLRRYNKGNKEVTIDDLLSRYSFHFISFCLHLPDLKRNNGQVFAYVAAALSKRGKHFTSFFPHIWNAHAQI